MHLIYPLPLIELTIVTTLNSHFGIEGIALVWFKNYLAPRDMKIKIGKSYSEIRAHILGITRILVWGKPLQHV